VTAVAEQLVAAGPRGRVAGRESRRGARALPPVALPDVPVVLATGQQMRPDAVSWPQTRASRDQVTARMLELAGQAAGSLPLHRMSVRRLLDWLEDQPGSTWQQRWKASGAEKAGKNWAVPLAGSGRRGGGTADLATAKSGMMLLLAGQVIRPGLEWLLEQYYYKTLTLAFTAIDPAGLAALHRTFTARGAGGDLATARNVIARIMICKGGPVTAITAGDCVWYWHTRRERGKTMKEGGLFYALLFEMGVFGPDAPPALMAATRRGQLSCAELIDRYQIQCAPSGTCWWTTWRSAGPRSITPRWTTWPATSGCCSGGIWSCTIPGSARCTCRRRWPGRGNCGCRPSATTRAGPGGSGRCRRTP
jgi:hypothetical protein